MLKKLFNRIGGDPNQKVIGEYSLVVNEINALESEFEALTDQQLAQKTTEFRARLADGREQGLADEDILSDILIEAFATVREASKRTLGMRHYDIQLIAGMILHFGQVAEMRTGEGKTLVATLPLYLNALTGKGVHLITVNDYLARRDARWNAPIFNLLGLSVGVLQMGSRTEGGRKAFLVDLEKESTTEDQHQLDMVDRKYAYLADITYGTNSEFGFDYLRDNGRMSLDARVQRGHHYAVIDEVDNVLIDEARTPLIISGPAFDDAETYVQMAQVVKRLKPEHYEINEKDRTITLTEIGESQVEEFLGMALRDPENPEEITDEQARLFGFLEQALRAEHLFKRDKDYIVQSRQIVIVDQVTGRMMPGRRWSDGLHQAVEAKEGVPVQQENTTHATITIQNYFRMYEKLCGMTGTAMTEAEEFSKIYNLETIALPSNLEYKASLDDAEIVELDAVDEQKYRYTYYAKATDPEKLPYLWKRKDYPDVVYRTKEAKLRAIVREVIQYHCLGRPILLGTTSVENSDFLSKRLNGTSIQKLLRTLLLRYHWLDQNNRIEDGRVIMALSFLNEPLEDLRNNDLKKLAQDLGITLDMNEENLQFLLENVFFLEAQYQEILASIAQRGVPHNVLNAREHTRESKLIAKAGNLGAVTIATNMAGRGVDIKLGGELPEDDVSYVNRVLKRLKVDDYFNFTLAEKSQALENTPASEYGVRPERVHNFIEHVNAARKVIEEGGLHVIGSERHEARRIDNQLRGRAARQGDPGSSRFYLSMEDDLMRLFGGGQMEAMMQRLGVDEQMPMEMGMVSRFIEGAQTRVEGANFDSRKHVLEYDDVLNSQRQTIYKQRDRIFMKEDLSEDILELLENELNTRIPDSLTQEQLPQILYWLSAIQPSFVIEKSYYPSFEDKLVLDALKEEPLGSQVQAVNALLKLAGEAARAYQDKVMADIETAVQAFEERIDLQYQDRTESLETFFEQLYYADETEKPTDQQVLATVKELTRLDIKTDTLLTALQGETETPSPPQPGKKSKYSKKKGRKGKSASLRNSTLIMDNLETAEELFETEIMNAVTSQAIERMLGAINRRLPEPLPLESQTLVELEWSEISAQVMEQVEEIFNKRLARLEPGVQSGMVERIENLFRYDLFVEASTEELSTFFNSLPPTQNGFEIEESAWRSIGNQIKIYIDRKKISAPPEADLFDANRDLLSSALDEFDPANWSLDSSAWDALKTSIFDHLEKFYDNWLVVQLIAGLRMLNQERKTVFTKGKKGTQHTEWFTYRQLAADQYADLDIESFKQEVIDHIKAGHEARVEVFGVKVWRRLSPQWKISELPTSVRAGLEQILPPEDFSAYQNASIGSIHPRHYSTFIHQLGQFEISEYYREIFLRVISRLWIEYITEMEALRVKIGLEAYAQRDPLVAYKTQASELFQLLFTRMQQDVVSWMFRNRGRIKGQKDERLALIEKIRDTQKENLSESHEQADISESMENEPELAE